MTEAPVQGLGTSTDAGPSVDAAATSEDTLHPMHAEAGLDGSQAGHGGAGSGGMDSAPAAGAESKAGAAGTGGKRAGTAGTAGADGADGEPGCTADFDPAHLPKRMALQGSVALSEPSLIQHEGTYYLFSTGDGIPIRTSRDLLSWQDAGSVFFSHPRWVDRTIADVHALWSPDISFFGGTYHLYYAASTEGSNRSCIGHATASTPAGPFTDQGVVVCSNVGTQRDDWNAIHPHAVDDASGKHYLAFGSFWSGLKLIALDDKGQSAGATDEPIALAKRPTHGGAIEAPFIVQRCGFYYLFASFDLCCDGVNSTYKVYVGRSKMIEGPYLDRDNTPMLEGGGSAVLVGDETWHGPGHSMIWKTAEGWREAHHAYYAGAATPFYQPGSAYLRISELVWDAQGWPVSGGP
jgi:arabinan endo-1,5-alpha-L-arabinosidase